MSGCFGFLIQVVSSSVVVLCWSFLDIMSLSRTIPPVLKDRACFSRLYDIFCFICERIHCSLVYYERRVTSTSCLAHLSSEVTNRDVHMSFQQMISVPLCRHIQTAGLYSSSVVSVLMNLHLYSIVVL